jgi:hypothetical protein
MLLSRSVMVVMLVFIAVLVSAQTVAAPAPSRINRERPVESTVRQDTPPAACQVTLPSDGTFVPSSPLPSGYGIEPPGHQFYFGSEKLWTVLPADGTWSGPIPQKPLDYAYGSKIEWFRLDPAFSWKDGPFTVTGERLDGPAPRFTETEPLWDAAMIIGGITIPVFGCWQITGHYKDQELKFTVWATALPEQKPFAAESSQKISEVPPTHETAPRRIQVDGETQAKELVYKVTPDVPAGTEEATISGTIVLQAVIKTDGRAEELRYVSGPPLLAQVAIDAVRWWQYRAVIIDGEAVEVDTTIEVCFPQPTIKRFQRSVSYLSHC